MTYAKLSAFLMIHSIGISNLVKSLKLLTIMLSDIVSIFTRR